MKERTVVTQDDLDQTEQAAVEETMKKTRKKRKYTRAAPKAELQPDPRSREPAHESRVQEMQEAGHERWSQPWSRGSTLPQNIPARPGMVQRWIRVSQQGLADITNSSSKQGEGWVPRLASTLPKNSFSPTIKEGAYAGAIGVAGMVLMEMPASLDAQRKAHYKKQGDRSTQGVNQELVKASKHGAHGFGRIQKAERTEVGLLREVKAADE